MNNNDTPATTDDASPRLKIRVNPPVRGGMVAAIKTGIICAAVFFVIGMACGLKLASGRKEDSKSAGEVARGPVLSASRASGAVSASPIRTQDDWERASIEERRAHAAPTARAANQSGAKYKVSAKEIQEGVDAFYSE